MAAKKQPSSFHSISDVIKDIRKGKMVILTDDADRENEGDLIMAAEKATPAKVNFMARYGRGLICAPITQERALQLGLQRMVLDNRESFKTDFTVSVDGAPKHGVGTGISAKDRAKTIQLLASGKSKPQDFVQPGHVFPLQAKEGGVLQRAGHTEAAIDLSRLAGLDESAVICEILKEDGSMARLSDLRKFAAEHSLKMATIQDLIEYRRLQEKLVEREESVPFETRYGTFQLHLYRSVADQNHHLALVKGAIRADQPVMVRVHSDSIFEDVFGGSTSSARPSIGDTLKRISKEGSGVLIYMRHLDQNASLVKKVRDLKITEKAHRPRRKNPQPGQLREYGLGAQILFDLGVRQMRLLTHQPKNVIALSAYGLEIVEQIDMNKKS
ncbi:MAG: 3,4-dihydroxy-2-butanone-4-phosphate synthase [Verrucomicrobiota bacterium]